MNQPVSEEVIIEIQYPEKQQPAPTLITLSSDIKQEWSNTLAELQGHGAMKGRDKVIHDRKKVK